MRIKKRDGSVSTFDTTKLLKYVSKKISDIEFIDAERIVKDAAGQLKTETPAEQLNDILALSCKTLSLEEPNYAYAGARFVLSNVYRDAFGHKIVDSRFEEDYKKAFIANTKLLVEQGILTPKCLEVFDLEALAENLKPERDLLFKQIGIQTLQDAYLQHVGKRRVETPQAFWMRVAMGLCLKEKNPEEMAIRAYEILSQFKVVPSSPTLFNSCTVRSQLSSCFLTQIDDSIDGIFGHLHQQAKLSKYAGGLSCDISNLRGADADIKGTNGKSNGVVPWIKNHDSMVTSVNQGGKRQGSEAIHLAPWHIDFQQFLELRKNVGDERLRAHNLNTASFAPDIFFKKILADDDWYMFCPSENRNLNETYGKEFEAEYNKMVDLAKKNKVRHKVIKAKTLWQNWIKLLKETGHPWISFKDPSNLRYSNSHKGTVYSSNLCQEIILHTKPTLYNEESMEVEDWGRVAVCNLASINLKSFIGPDGSLDYDDIGNCTRFWMRMLDNVIDLNFYPVPPAKLSNMESRPVGFGQMGWNDVCDARKIAIDSDEAVKLADEMQEYLSFNAILASSELAAERGAYETYEGSTWSKGSLPLDTYAEFISQYRPKAKQPATGKMDWEFVRKQIAKHGMRNSNVTMICPTATSSFIVGSSQSIEPNDAVMFSYGRKNGQFPIINEFFVKELKELGLWNKNTAREILSVDGKLDKLDWVPEDLKKRYSTSMDKNMFKLIDATAARQKWIDMSQSFNIYYAGNKGSVISDIYLYAWEQGLKTTYYLRSKAANTSEKITTKKTEKEEAKECSVEAMRNGTECLACQ